MSTDSAARRKTSLRGSTGFWEAINWQISLVSDCHACRSGYCIRPPDSKLSTHTRRHKNQRPMDDNQSNPLNSEIFVSCDACLSAQTNQQLGSQHPIQRLFVSFLLCGGAHLVSRTTVAVLILMERPKWLARPNGQVWRLTFLFAKGQSTDNIFIIIQLLAFWFFCFLKKRTNL